MIPEINLKNKKPNAKVFYIESSFRHFGQNPAFF